DRRADDLVGARANVDFCEAFSFSVEECPIDLRKILGEGCDSDSAPFGLRFVQADMRDLGIGVGAPWNRQGADSRAAKEQGVAQYDACMRIREMRELERGGAIARGVDSWIAGAQIVVDLDSVGTIVGHARGFEPHPLDRGRTPDANKDFIRDYT